MGVLYIDTLRPDHLGCYGYHRNTSPNIDPMMTVLREGGPFHTRGELPVYLERLESTGRVSHVKTLAAKHPSEI